jgi:3-oxoacyl-[acyl-carrier protein] reductase
MDLGIAGKRVLITGASKNIGLATVNAFVNEGAHVSLVARNREKLADIVQKIGGAAKGHYFIDADLLTPNSPSQVVHHFLALHGNIDIVVHNVGGALGAKDFLGSVDSWLKVWQFNVGIAIEINNLLIPSMVRNNWGRIVHISSISGKMGEPLKEPFGGSLPYAASKSFLNTYAVGLGRELAKNNVIVSALLPGAVQSEGKYWDKLKQSNPQLVDSFVNQHYPIGRFALPDEIASFAVFMASNQNSYAAGSLVTIDGGRL